MLKLLGFEFRKLFRQKSFYICILVLIALVLVTVYATEYTYRQAEMEFADGCDAFALSTSLHDCSFYLILGIFVAVFVCEDYAAGTVRNIVTRGYSRTAMFFSKLIVTLVATVIMMIITMACSYLSGYIAWGHGEREITAEVITAGLCQLAVCAAFACLYFTVSISLQKTGGAVAVCILISMIVPLVMGLVDNIFYDEVKDIYYSDYWLGEMLAHMPLFDADTELFNKTLITSGVYFAASAVIGWLATFRREY